MSPPAAPEPVFTASGRFLLLDHTADLRLRLHAPTPRALYCTAVQALGRVLSDPAAAPGETESVPIELQGADPADLLVCLLNEALFQVERTGWIPVDFEATHVGATELRGLLRLRAADPSTEGPLEVKAATYSELRWETSGGELVAELTLDL